MRPVRRFRPILVTLVLTGALAGCATRPPASQPDALAEYKAANDPLEPFNRKMYGVNNAIDTYALRPAAVAYKNTLPNFLRNGIHNILGNLVTPVKLGNDMLQGKPQRAGTTLMRFVINSTVGGLGFFDLATDWGYPSHDTDFGVTLALWGAGTGPYLFLPVLGPGNARDSSGRIVDIAADPLGWVGQGAVVTGLNVGHFVVFAVDQRAQLLGTLSQIKKTALDPYATFRSLYRQHREAQIQEIRNDNKRTIPAWFPQPAASPAR
jgi:phospholipid-binding lipoprotein MlaA